VINNQPINSAFSKSGARLLRVSFHIAVKPSRMCGQWLARCPDVNWECERFMAALANKIEQISGMFAAHKSAFRPSFPQCVSKGKTTHDMTGADLG
jgi:hypothetical protein